MFKSKFGRISLACSLVLSLGLSACGTDGGALPQHQQSTKVETQEKRPLNQLLVASEERLQKIEAETGQMMLREVITTTDNNNMLTVMEEYTDYMQYAYAATRRDVDLADRTQGKDGASLSAAIFEEKAQNHETRLGKVMGKVEAISARIANGQVVFERGIIESMGEQEREDFRASLAPSGEKKMQQLYPDLFPKKPLSNRLRRGASQMVGAATQMCRTMPSKLEQLLIPRVEASIVFRCVGPCIAAQWGACAACVASSVPAAIQGVRDFESCWRRSSNWIWRAGCVWRLIKVLA